MPAAVRSYGAAVPASQEIARAAGHVGRSLPHDVSPGMRMVPVLAALAAQAGDAHHPVPLAL